MRRAVALAGLALAAAAALSGCGGEDPPPDYPARAREACAGATTGARALAALGGATGPGMVVARVKRAEKTATRAAKTLDHLTPPDELAERQDEAVRVLLAQATRLRLVREQIRRGSAAHVVLDAARAGLTAGDRQTRSRLAAIGVQAC